IIYFLIILCKRFCTRIRLIFIVKGEGLMFKSGDKPGAGRYKCLTCGDIIYLFKNSDILPFCPECKATVWVKFSQTLS
ncbi:hypothetical protein ATY00_10260, partial [Oenococcus oeni]